MGDIAHMSPEELHRAGVPVVEALKARLAHTEERAMMYGSLVGGDLWRQQAFAYRDAIAIITARENETEATE